MSDTETPPVEYPKSAREKAMETPRKKIRSRRGPPRLTDKMRAHLYSPEHLARCAEALRKWREANGGKQANCKGTPQGWGGKLNRKKRARILAMAEEKAGRIMDKLIENGVVQKDSAGNAVLAWTIGVVLAKDEETGKPAYPLSEQVKAAKMVLEYTMQKPVARAEVTHTAESFLQGLLNETEETPK